MKTYKIHDTNAREDVEIKAEDAKQAFELYAKQANLKGNYALAHFSGETAEYRANDEPNVKFGYGVVTIKAKCFTVCDEMRTGNHFAYADNAKDAWRQYKERQNITAEYNWINGDTNHAVYRSTSEKNANGLACINEVHIGECDIVNGFKWC